jgi:hypothetical protein
MTSSKRLNVSGPGCNKLTIRVVPAAFANDTIELDVEMSKGIGHGIDQK